MAGAALCGWLLLAGRGWGEGRGQAAAPRVATAAAQEPAETAAAEARRLMDSGQFPAAEARLREALERSPETAELHYLLGYVLFRTGQGKASLAEMTEGARFRTPRAEELVVVASDYILLKDYPDAEHWLRYTLERTPGDAQAWYLLGRTQYNQDHAAEAVASFLQCLKLRPRDERAEYNLGLAYERAGQREAARTAYQAAMAWQRETGVRDAQPYLDLGMLEMSEQHTAAALPLLEEATRLAPRNAMAFQQLGVALEALGRGGEAIPAYQTASRLAPEAEQPHYFLGRLLHRMGRNAEAEQEFAKAKALLGTHSDTETRNADSAH